MLSLLIILKQVIYLVNLCFIICNTYLSFEKFNFNFLPKIYLKIALGAEQNEKRSDSDACGSPQWFGDNYCDDDNNNEECGWDGGDCCGDNVITFYCSACECLDPNGRGDGTTEPPTDSCQYPHWKGDNYCDDDNNNEGK